MNESYNIMRENDKFLEELEAENEDDKVEPLMDTLINLKYKNGSLKSSVLSNSKHIQSKHLKRDSDAYSMKSP